MGLVLPFYFAGRPLLPGEVRRGGRQWHVIRNFAILWVIIATIRIIPLIAVEILSAQHMDLMGVLHALRPVTISAEKWLLPAAILILMGLGVRRRDVVERDDRPAVDERIDRNAEEAHVPTTKLAWQPIAVLAAIVALGVMFALS